MPLAWSDGDFISSYKLNTSTYHRMTGLEMEALSSTDTVSGMIVFCTQNSSVFTAGNTYSRSLDNSSWETFDIASTQDAVDDIITDMGTVHAEKDLSPTKAKFNEYLGSGGTVTQSVLNIVEVNTNTTVGGHATIERAGVCLSFTAPSSFQVKLRVTSSTNFTRCRVGIVAETASENNITNTRKYGIEGCSSSGVNWLVFSATATNRTTISTATPVATAAHTSYRVSNNLSDITFRVGTSTSAVKTTDVPNTFRSDHRFFRAGLQNTAAENKQMFLAGLAWAGTVDDPGWM
jgi:hypothetical protein